MNWRSRLNDPVLVFFLDYLRSQGEQQGLDKWCRENGILGPWRERTVAWREAAFSEFGSSDTERLFESFRPAERHTRQTPGETDGEGE